jgi:hypothetical protein
VNPNGGETQFPPSGEPGGEPGSTSIAFKDRRGGNGDWGRRLLISLGANELETQN